MRQSRLYRTEGIVLRERDYAEADRILSVLTPGGKLSVLAKGIRRPTSRKVGHLGLFYRANLMIARGRNLDIVTQAESISEFDGIRNDLVRFTYACYVGELVERMAPENEESPLYGLTVQALHWLDVERDPRLWLRYFELLLLRIGGYQPELFTCLACDRDLEPTVNYFSADEGGMLCARCGQHRTLAKAVSLNAQKVLRYLQTHQADEVRCLSLTETTHNEIESLLYRYLEYVLEREVRSVVFLQRLRRELRAIERAASMTATAPEDEPPEPVDI